MSYRSKQPVATSRHRSSSAVRTGSSTPSSPSSYTNHHHRPRSMGYYTGANTAPYSSPYNSTTSSGANSLYSNLSGGGYGSNYQSPYFQNGYRSSPPGGGYSSAGNAGAGYASLTIPAKTLNSAYNSPNFAKYENRDQGNHRSRRDAMSRSGSYRDRSVSRSRNPLSSGGGGSGMGSRSLSLTSLNSDTGYVSGSDRSSRSRISSTADIRNENGEIDYKKLYEQQLVENERLKDKLKKSEEELRETKQTLEKINVVTSKNSLSELEKRERRAMERKLSEMEEELKNLENLKSENQRLKDENGALIRVISKLSK